MTSVTSLLRSQDSISHMCHIGLRQDDLSYFFVIKSRHLFTMAFERGGKSRFWPILSLFSEMVVPPPPPHTVILILWWEMCFYEGVAV